MEQNEYWKGLKKAFTVRSASIDDVEIAVELFNQCSTDMMGVRDWELMQKI
jgi:hypothetical protein